MEKNKAILKRMTSVSLGIMISRILGYLRDMLVASTFGAGFYADAFYAAFRIPNLFRRLFGEASLNAAFVPVFSEVLIKNNKQKTEEFISAVFTVMFVLLSMLTILGILFALPITKLITWGFDKEKLLLTKDLLQIMFPYMILICLAALWLSILNCLKIFFMPAMSSGSLSISEIFFVLFLASLLPEKQRIVGLAVSVLVGGLLQFFVNFMMVKKHYTFRLDFKKFFYFLALPEVKRIYILFVPVVIGFSVDQINALVDTLCASFLKEGSITALYYSNRLMQLPLALFTISLTTVALPQMSQEVVSENYEELKLTIIHSIRNILFFILPATVGLIIIGEPIIRTLFEHGKFNYEASKMTYSCLAFYSAGLLFFSTTKIFTSVFYALKQPRYPVKIAGYMLILNAILNVILMQFLEVGGLALATSASSFVASVLLYRKLKKILEFNFSSLKKYFGLVMLSNLFVCIYLLIVKSLVKNFIFVTVFGICGAVFIYFFTTKFFKIEETEFIDKLLQRFLPFNNDRF